MLKVSLENELDNWTRNALSKKEILEPELDVKIKIVETDEVKNEVPPTIHECHHR